MRHGRPIGAVLAVLSLAGRASAEPVRSGACDRPVMEGDTWVTLGGGVGDDGGEPAGIFELGGGSQVTFGVSPSGDLRLGAFGQLSTGSFDTGWIGGGPALYFTNAPAELDMFQWRGDGVFSMRLLGGLTWGGDTAMAPIVGGTLSWGYRAPFDLSHTYECDPQACDGGSPCRACYRYFTGVRLFVSTHCALAGEGGWQATTGIEFEPVGSIRYLFGLY